MQRHRNLNGTSNILNFEIGNDHIIIEFDSGNYRFYKYSYMSTGQGEVDRMKTLAIQGYGLNEFISEEVKNNYENRW